MSDGVDDIPVVETTESVPSAEPVAAAGGMEESVALMPSEIEATQVNLDPADNVLTNNKQQEYNEIVAPDRVSETAPALTQQGRDAKEAAHEDRKAQILEAQAQQETEAKRREEWLEREHEFAGMRMSGYDLDKLMNFYANNPQMQDQLKNRLVKSGMSKDKIDKGMKEFQEFMDLKKKK